MQVFDLALAQDFMALLGSFSTLSSDLPSLLTTDPPLALEPILSSLLSDLGLPGVVTGGNLSADLTNIVANCSRACSDRVTWRRRVCPPALHTR